MEFILGFILVMILANFISGSGGGGWHHLGRGGW